MRRLSIGVVAAGLIAACSSSNSDGPSNTTNPPAVDAGNNNTNTDPATCKTSPCADGVACTAASDCTSGICFKDVCTPLGCADGIKNRDETDTDCGGSCILGCAPTKSCNIDNDCLDLVCSTTTKTCRPPTSGDKLKNGRETDVDCGNSQPGDRFDTKAPACEAGKICIADADCKSGGCNQDSHTCAFARSCAMTNGGQTCGAGDVTSASRNHEDCCTSAEIAPYTQGNFTNTKRFRLDKYTVTAGRMRKFVDAVKGNVQGWVSANRDKVIAPDQLPATVDKYLPAGYTQPDSTDDCTGDSGGTYKCNYGALAQLSGFRYNNEPGGDGGYACNIGPNEYGARTFYMTQEELGALKSSTTSRGQTESQHLVPKDRLAQKAEVCANYYMLAAFCAWDGGRLETLDEYNAAYGGDGTNGDVYPWEDQDSAKRALGFYDLFVSNLYPNVLYNPDAWLPGDGGQGDTGADSQCTGNATTTPGCLAKAKPDAVPGDDLYNVTLMGAGTTRYSVYNPHIADDPTERSTLLFRLRRANAFWNYANYITTNFFQTLGAPEQSNVAAEQVPVSDDQSVAVAPPGRYPSGYGKRGGHADLLGNVMEITATTEDGQVVKPTSKVRWTRNGSYETAHFNQTTMVGGVSTKLMLTKDARAGGRCARPLDVYKALP